MPWPCGVHLSCNMQRTPVVRHAVYTCHAAPGVQHATSAGHTAWHGMRRAVHVRPHALAAVRKLPPPPGAVPRAAGGRLYAPTCLSLSNAASFASRSVPICRVATPVRDEGACTPVRAATTNVAPARPRRAEGGCGSPGSPRPSAAAPPAADQTRRSPLRQQAAGRSGGDRPTWRAVILSMNMSRSDWRSASSGRLPSALTDGLADAALACQLSCACESDQPHHIAD